MYSRSRFFFLPTHQLRTLSHNKRPAPKKKKRGGKVNASGNHNPHKTHLYFLFLIKAAVTLTNKKEADHNDLFDDIKDDAFMMHNNLATEYEAQNKKRLLKQFGKIKSNLHYLFPKPPEDPEKLEEFELPQMSHESKTQIFFFSLAKQKKKNYFPQRHVPAHARNVSHPSPFRFPNAKKKSQINPKEKIVFFFFFFLLSLSLLKVKVSVYDLRGSLPTQACN